MPRVKQLWLIFSIGVITSSIFMLPLLVNGVNALTILFLIIALPAWILGFQPQYLPGGLPPTNILV